MVCGISTLYIPTVTRYTELRTLANSNVYSRIYIYCDILHVVQLMLCIPTLHVVQLMMLCIPKGADS